MLARVRSLIGRLRVHTIPLPSLVGLLDELLWVCARPLFLRCAALRLLDRSLPVCRIPRSATGQRARLGWAGLSPTVPPQKAGGGWKIGGLLCECETPGLADKSHVSPPTPEKQTVFLFSPILAREPSLFASFYPPPSVDNTAYPISIDQRHSLPPNPNTATT